MRLSIYGVESGCELTTRVEQIGDGRVFHFNELTQANMTINQSNTEITAGWSLFPVAVLPGTSTLEMTFTSAKFEPELFAMTNATELAESTTYEDYKTVNLTATVADTLSLDLGTDVLVTGSISIRGMTQVAGTPAASGEFKWTAPVAPSTTGTLTFFSGDVAVGTMVEIHYRHTVTIQEMKVDNRAAAIGEVVAKYPVYSDGTDCTAAGIIGYAYLKVFQARITSQPTLAGSYKSASTYDFTISAIDPKGKGGLTENGTEAVYSIGYKALT